VAPLTPAISAASCDGSPRGCLQCKNAAAKQLAVSTRGRGGSTASSSSPAAAVEDACCCCCPSAADEDADGKEVEADTEVTSAVAEHKGVAWARADWRSEGATCMWLNTSMCMKQLLVLKVREV